MKPFVLRIALAALVLVSAPHVVFGEVIFDNLAATTGGGGTFPNGSVLFAQQFQTTATGYVLDSVTVKVRNNTGSATGNFSLSVYTSASNDPGTQVGSFGPSTNWSTLVGTAYQDKTINGLLTLSPSTTYFMVMSVADSSNGEWAETQTAPGLAARESSNGGSSWVDNSPYFPQMQVTAVPEPALWTFGASGLVAWWGLRRRGRRRLALGAPVTGNAA